MEMQVAFDGIPDFTRTQKRILYAAEVYNGQYDDAASCPSLRRNEIKRLQESARDF